MALEARKRQQTLNELASELGVHAVRIAQWQRQAQEGISGVVASPGARRLNGELDWRRKKWS